MDGNRPYIWTLIAYTVNPTKKEVDLPVFHDVSVIIRFLEWLYMYLAYVDRKSFGQSG